MSFDLHGRRPQYLAAAVAGVVIAGRTLAFAADPTTQELLEQVKALNEKVAQLQARQDASESANQQSTAATLEKDAARHDNLLDVTGVNAGYSNGRFFIQSDDGNFVLHPWLLFQFRDVTAGRQHGQANGSDDWQNGFEVKRLKFGFDGNAFTPDLTYFFLWNTSPAGGGVTLSEGYARYHFADTPFSIKGGQFKNPFNKEQLVPDQFELAEERTLLTDLLANGEGFIKGATLMYDNGGPLRGQIAVTDGMRDFNTTFLDFPTNAADYGGSARVEYKLLGNWKDYNDFTARGVKDDLLVFGAAADYLEAGKTDVISYTGDVMYKSPTGLGAFAALLGRHGRDVAAGSIGSDGGLTGTAVGHNVNDIGAEGQVSYCFNENVEAFGRYTYISFDKNSVPTGAHDSYHEITAGMNYYLYGHHAKFTADLSYLPTGAPVTDEISGILANNHGEWLLRAQFQLFL